MTASTEKPYHHGSLAAAAKAAALALVEARGDASFAMRDLAARIGVSHAALYRHFPDRASIFVAIAREGFASFLASEHAALAACGDDPVDQLAALARNHVRFALAHSGLYRVMFGARIGEHTLDDPTLTEAARPTLDVVSAIVARLPIPPQTRPLDIAVMLWSSVHGLAILGLDDQLKVLGSPDGGHLQALAEAAVRALTAGFCGQAGSPARGSMF